MAVDLERPAIIQRAPLLEVRYGLSYAVSRVGYDRITLPRDFRDATLTELLPWLPSDMRHLPPWALMGIIPGMGGLAGFTGSSGLNKTIVTLSITSAANQTWPVLSDWNASDNSIECGSQGGNGGGGGNDDCGCDGATGGGGGGGGKALKNNVTLTPSGSMTYHLEDGGAGTGTGQATWANGATLGASSAGICGGSTGGNGTSARCTGSCCCSCSNGAPGTGGAGASTSGAKGDTTTAGSVGGDGNQNPGGGGSGGAGVGLGGTGGAGGTAGSGNSGTAGAIQIINNKSL